MFRNSDRRHPKNPVKVPKVKNSRRSYRISPELSPADIFDREHLTKRFGVIKAIGIPKSYILEKTFLDLAVTCSKKSISARLTSDAGADAQRLCTGAEGRTSTTEPGSEVDVGAGTDARSRNSSRAASIAHAATTVTVTAPWPGTTPGPGNDASHTALPWSPRHSTRTELLTRTSPPGPNHSARSR